MRIFSTSSVHQAEKATAPSASCAGLRWLMGASALSLTAAIAAPWAAHAATPATSTEAIPEIVVTAEHREQSVQKTPLTLQVLSSAQIRKAGLSKADGLSNITTGIEIGSAGGSAQIFIRGIGSYAQTPLQSPGVAFNVDGVYVGRPDSTNGNFYDLSRIEVLKGPQGTLYGRNANGGAVNLITNEPKLHTTSADLNVDLGDYDLVHVGGDVNLPIDDTKAIRLAFNDVSRRGYLSDGADDDKQQEGRLRFKWKPDDKTSLLLNADYAHLGGMGTSYVDLPQCPGCSPYEAAASATAQAFQHSFNNTTAPLTVQTKPDDFQDSSYYNLSGQLDTDVGIGKLTILPAYRHSDTNYRTESGTRYESHTKTDQESLEIRLGNSTPLVTWVAGAYGYIEDQKGTNDILGAALFLSNHIIYAPTTNAYAGFGQATVNVLPGFRLIGGLRYTYERRTDSGSLIDTRFGGYSLQESFPGKADFKGVTYRAGAEYDITSQSMVYATYSTGFKAGGFNQTIAPENTFQPEKLDALELGSHNRFFGGKLQLNGTLYQWKYLSLQDSRINFDPLGNINFITFNSGNATVEGGTLEAVGRVTKADTIHFSGEYAFSRYDSYNFETPAAFFQPGSSGCRLTTIGATVHGNCSGFPVAHVPRWSGTASYDHIFFLGDGANITFDAAAKYTGEHYLAIDFIPVEKQGAYTIFDASLTYDSPDRRWSATLYGKNLTDKVYYQGGVQTPFIGGLFNAAIGAPRTFGVQAAYHFGG